MKNKLLARYQRAYTLWRRQHYAEAEACLRRAWEQLGIKTLRGMLLLAYCQRDQRQIVSEIATLRELLQTFAQAPEQELLADAWSLLGAALRELGGVRHAVTAFERAAAVEPWPAQRLVELSNAIFTANADPEAGEEAFRRLYAQYRQELSGLQLQAYPAADWQHDRLRVGYLSADFGNHPVGQFIAPLFQQYDRAHFAVYAYDRAPHEDAVAQALRAGDVVWRDVSGLSYAALAAQIRVDAIDILVDLGGHTANNALPVLACRAAPVQISGIGYFNSTGLRECAGFLSDVYCTPMSALLQRGSGRIGWRGAAPYFNEQLLRMPHSHFCYAPFTHFPAVGPLPCQTRGYVTFGCFNNFAKVTDAMLGLWRQILMDVPTAHLLLKHSIFDSAEGREYCQKRFQRLELPLERIELRGFSADYLAQYNDVDIALDTAPYTGGLTTCEALYMGVPVVTLAGDRHGARFGCSFLSNIGLAELVADTPARYVELATGLAGDPALLQQMRAKLRTRMQHSPLMDSQGYMRDLENIYQRLWRERRTIR